MHGVCICAESLCSTHPLDALVVGLLQLRPTVLLGVGQVLFEHGLGDDVRVGGSPAGRPAQCAQGAV
jgi:hypothetical protein